MPDRRKRSRLPLIAIIFSPDTTRLPVDIVPITVTASVPVMPLMSVRLPCPLYSVLAEPMLNSRASRAAALVD